MSGTSGVEAAPAVDPSELQALLKSDKQYLPVVRNAAESQVRSGMSTRMTADITGKPEAARRFNEFKMEEERALLKVNDDPFFARVDTTVSMGGRDTEPLTLLITRARMNCLVGDDAWELVSWTNPITQLLLDKRPGETHQQSAALYRIGSSSRYEGAIVPFAQRARVQVPAGIFYIENEEEYFGKPIEQPTETPAPREYEAAVSFGLGDIIVTADAPQRVAMMLPFAQSALIEGPPGSGKTSIGIMRIACLADQQWNERGLEKGKDRPFHEYQSMRVLVFNDEMVEYLKQLVSSIGVEKVIVQTTKKLLKEICRTAGTLSGREIADKPSVAAVKGQRKTLAAYWAGFKVHLQQLWTREQEALLLSLDAIALETAPVKRALIDWVNRIEKAELRGETLSVSCNLNGSLDDWARARRGSVPELETVPSMPSDRMSRAQAEARLNERASVIAMNQARLAKRQATERMVNEVEKAVRGFVRKAVERESIAKEMFTRPEYSAVLSSAIEKGVSRKRVEAGDRQWRRQYEVDNPGYSEYDLAVAAWLGNQLVLAPSASKKSLVGGVRPRITHLVVDEVQDLSPCHIGTLRSLMDAEGTMTLVGDLRQNLHPAGGMRQWEDIEIPDLQRRMFGVNYRQTRELGEFVRELHLRLFGSASGWESSPTLTGPIPRVTRIRSWQSAVGTVATEIRHWRTVTPRATVAVLYDTRLTPKRLRWLRDKLEDSLRSDLLDVHAIEQSSRSGQLRDTDCVLIASVRQTKGLEFDAVIHLDFREDWAEESEDVNPRLRNGLYVASSRARSGLTLCMRVLPGWIDDVVGSGSCEQVDSAEASEDDPE